jgi:ribonuclease BN (tRNA processing enzyme)
LDSTTPDRASVQIQIAGGGDAFGSGGQFQTCFIVDDSHGRFAIDFGATSMVALSKLGIDAAEIELVVLSHLHGDHFGGLPFLLLQRQFAASTCRPLTLAGPVGLQARIGALMDCMYPGLWNSQWRFAIDFVEIALDHTTTVLGRRIVAQKARHFAGAQDCLSLRIETDNRVIAFSGDTGWRDDLIDLARESDLFICECNERLDQPYDTHISFETLSKNIDRLHTKRLLVSHLGPEMVGAIDGLPVEAATFGLKLAL